jgi:hypothetical protein
MVRSKVDDLGWGERIKKNFAWKRQKITDDTRSKMTNLTEGMDSSGSGLNPMTGSCEHENEP